MYVWWSLCGTSKRTVPRCSTLTRACLLQRIFTKIHLRDDICGENMSFSRFLPPRDIVGYLAPTFCSQKTGMVKDDEAGASPASEGVVRCFLTSW